MREKNENWEVGFSTWASKRKEDLPEKVKDLLDTLAKEIELFGLFEKIGQILEL